MDENAPTFLHASLRRRHPLAALAAILLVVAAPPALVVGALAAGILPLAALAPLSMLGGILLWTANPARRERLGQLAAGELGLFFEGRRLASRASIQEGRLLPGHGDAPIVRLSTASGPVEVRVADALAGEALLRALGLGSSCPQEVRFASRVFSDPTAFAQVTLAAVLLPLLFGAVGFASGIHPILCAVLGVVTAAAVALVLVAVIAPTSLSLGEVGVSVGWLGRRRFLRYEEIDGVRLWDEAHGALGGGRRRGMSVFLGSGEVLHFALGDAEPQDAEAVAERLRQAAGTLPPALGYREPVAALVVVER